MRTDIVELAAHRITGWFQARASWTVGLVGMFLGPPACFFTFVVLHEVGIPFSGHAALLLSIGVGVVACFFLPTRYFLVRLAVALAYVVFMPKPLSNFLIGLACVIYGDCV
jgi:hypothetical protein